MLKIRKALVILLIFGLAVAMFYSLTKHEVRAAGPFHLNLDVEKDSDLLDKITDTTVTLKWDDIPGAASYEIWRDDIGKIRDVITEVYTVTDLEPNIMYHFTVIAEDSMGVVIPTDKNQLNVLTAMTFTSEHIPETVIPENEGGLKPVLKMEWNIPTYWDGADFVEIPEDRIDYRITVGTDKPASNMGTYQLHYNGSGYSLFKQEVDASFNTVLESIYAPAIDTSNGFLTYEWWRFNQLTGIINDEAIKPGTVYYMKISPIFNNPDNPFNQTFDILAGDIKYRRSPLKDGYTYTPLHIKIAKDANNNATCVIGRINYDTGDDTELIDFRYGIYSSPDLGFASSTLEGYEYEQYGDPTKPIEVFIPPKNNTSVYYYKVVATSDATDKIESPLVSYTMAADPGNPTIPQNVTVDKLEIVTQDNGGGNITKSVDVTLKWDRPEEFEDFPVDNFEYYMYLSSEQNPLTTAEGVYYKEEIDGVYYDIKYRNIKVVNGAMLDLSEDGFVKYKLKGLELFSVDGGSNHGDALNNSDSYPDHLLLDKTYYFKVSASRISPEAFSDYSIPISFTATYRKPPVPRLFNARTITVDNIVLAWEKVDIDLQNYSVQDGAACSVSYEVFSTSKDVSGNFVEPYDLIATVNEPGHGLGERTLSLTDVDGDPIKPNTIYYFVIRTRLNIDSEDQPRYSDFSQIIPVTTPKDGVVPPEDNENIVRTPADFAVDTDSEGNPRITVDSVTLKWTWLQEDANYVLVRTSKPVNPEDSISTIQQPGYDYYQYTIPGDSDITLTAVGDSVYTAEVSGLEFNKLYYFSLRGERGEAVSQWICVPVNTGLLEEPRDFTLERNEDSDRFSSLRIRWTGKQSYNYQAYIRADGSTNKDYSLADLEITSSEDTGTAGYRTYHAVIDDLNSNTKYSIKLRAVDQDNSSICSKFVGPVIGRTEFNEDDYQDDQRDKEEDDIFDERAKVYRGGLYITLDNSDSETRVKLRAAKVINTMQNDNSDRLVIDISGLKKNSKEKVFIVPLSIINYINNKKEILVLKSKSGEMYIKPMTMDDQYHPDVIIIKDKISDDEDTQKEEYMSLRVTLQRIDEKSSSVSVPTGTVLASEINDFTMEVIRFSRTEESIEDSINERYEEIREEKLDDLNDTDEDDKDTPEELEELITNLIEEAEDEVADYISSRLSTSSSSYYQEVSDMTNPIQFRYPVNLSLTGQYLAYQYRQDKWNRLGTAVDNFNRFAVFEILKPGRIAVLRKDPFLGGISDKNIADQLRELDSKYNISELVVENGIFRGQDPITLKQMIAVIARILGEDTHGSDDIFAKVNDRLNLGTGMTKFADSHKLTREEVCYIAMKLYSERTGTSIESLKPGRTVNLADAKSINKVYNKSVIMAVDLKLVTPDSANRILPSNTISKQDTLIVIKRVLTLTGDI